MLRSLQPEDIADLLKRALADEERGLGKEHLQIEPDALDLISRAADGDGRRALNMLELASSLVESGSRTIDMRIALEVASGTRRRFDKGGDQFYDQISALHKAVRGTDPDAALYWLARMLDGGCDPLYIARRVVRMAIEDVGLADPRAFEITLNAWEAYDRLGSPEGELAIANAVVFLAVAPKSNAVYVAMGEAKADVEQFGTLDVPARFRNAPTKLMKELGHGAGYRYAHNEPGAYCRRGAVPARRDAGSAILSTGKQGSRDQDRRGVSAVARRPRLARKRGRRGRLPRRPTARRVAKRTPPAEPPIPAIRSNNSG